MITESEVQNRFRSIFSTQEKSPEDFDRAEDLLEQLRPESPLRHRLGGELEELRQLFAANS